MPVPASATARNESTPANRYAAAFSHPTQPWTRVWTQRNLVLENCIDGEMTELAVHDTVTKYITSVSKAKPVDSLFESTAKWTMTAYISEIKKTVPKSLQEF